MLVYIYMYMCMYIGGFTGAVIEAVENKDNPLLSCACGAFEPLINCGPNLQLNKNYQLSAA